MHLVIDLGTHERQLGRGVVGVSPQRQSSYRTGLSGQRIEESTPPVSDCAHGSGDALPLRAGCKSVDWRVQSLPFGRVCSCCELRRCPYNELRTGCFQLRQPGARL